MLHGKVLPFIPEQLRENLASTEFSSLCLAENTAQHHCGLSSQ